MVKIINGEIVDESDPRARALIDAQHQHQYMYQQWLAHYYQQQQQFYERFLMENQHLMAQQQQQQGVVTPPPPIPPPSMPSMTSPSLPASSSTLSVSTMPGTPQLTLVTGPVGSPNVQMRRLSLSSASGVANSPVPVHPRRLSVSTQPSPAPVTSTGDTVAPIQPPSTYQYPRRSPNSYNLFGMPSLIISGISVKPHVYLLALLLFYFIGPPVLVPLLAAFFFYRWHLNREEQLKENARLETKFSQFRNAKTRPRVTNTAIHSLNDWHSQ